MNVHIGNVYKTQKMNVYIGQNTKNERLYRPNTKNERSYRSKHKK